jgi:hypothetical protein
MDGDKVVTITSWPQPWSACRLRGFLGLASYYRCFIKDFGTLAAPLTQLLHKDGFLWTDEATNAFTALKEALSTVPVHHLLDFTKSFTRASSLSPSLASHSWSVI